MKSPIPLFFALCILGIPADATFAQQLSAQVFGGSPDGEAPGPAYRQWTTFLHPRLGYELPVPPGVRALSDPERATKATFVSSDGRFAMSVWGGSSRQPARTVLDAQWKAAKTWPGRTIDFEVKAKSWFVVSGIDETGAGFYQKFVVHGYNAAGCFLTYPPARARDFAPWVEGIERGFRFVSNRAEPSATLPRFAFGKPSARSADSWPHLALEASATRRDRLATPGFSSQLPLESIRSGTVTPPASGSLIPARETWDSTRDFTPPPEASEPDPVPSQSTPAQDRDAETPTETVENHGRAEMEKQPKATPSDGKDLPVAEKVPGKAGFVYSPYTSAQSLVDVVDLPSGTKARCPYTRKIFRVP